MHGKSIRVFLFLFLTAALLCCFAFSAGALQTEEPTSSDGPAGCAVHTPGTWTPDGRGGHTSVCTVCGEKLQEACAYGAEKTAAPTETLPGTSSRVCGVCGYTLTQTTSPAEKDRTESRIMGDVDFNGKADSADARAILRASVRLAPIADAALPYADINLDGTISAADARLVLRTDVGLEEVRRHQINASTEKQPTCTAVGKLTWKCVYCGEEKALAIPAKGHDWSDATPTRAPQCRTCGVKTTGWYYLDGKRYYYNPDGGVTAGGSLVNVELGGTKAYWYLNNGAQDTAYRGQLTYGGADWIVTNGTAEKVVTKYQRTLFRAYGEVAKATTPDMTPAEKLRACFVYCKTHYTERRPRTPHYTGVDWPLVYANDMFAGRGGNCFSYAAAYAFMAKAIGYENVYCCNSGGHGWAEINGNVYDAEWSKRDGLNAVTYFDLSYDKKTDVAYKSAISANLDWMHVKVQPDMKDNAGMDALLRAEGKTYF